MESKRLLLWRIHHRLLLFVLLVLVLCQAAGVVDNDDSTSSSSLLSSSTNSATDDRTFRPIFNSRGEPGHLKYYERPDGTLGVRYYDSVGKVDLPVPRHFQRLSEDRVVDEIRWNAETDGNWTERTALEILFHAVTEPPVRDESILSHRYDDEEYYHPKAALKQQQRHQYYLTSNRRTYQQYLQENAVAAAVAHRAGSTNMGGQVGIPILARKIDSAYGWLREDIDICDWEGVVCGDFSPTNQYYWDIAGIIAPATSISLERQLHQRNNENNSNNNKDSEEYRQRKEAWECEDCPQPPPTNRVTKIELPYAGLVGTLPPEIAMLRYLYRLDLRGNRIYGSLPTSLSQMEYLQYLDLTRNDLTGSLPEEPDPPTFPERIKELWLGSNQLKGRVPLEMRTPELLHLDLSKNQFTGSLPRYGRKQLPKLKSLFLEDNQLTGKLPPKWIGLTDLEVIDVGYNLLNGTIPTIYGAFTNLRELNIVGNFVSGTIPTELMKLSNLESLMLSENRLRGTIPAGDDTVPSRAEREPEAGYKWSQMEKLQYFHVSDNFLTSTIPPDLFYGLRSTILGLDLAYNELTGTIAKEIATCSHLERINLQANYIGGTMPTEMSKMNPNLELNFTNNMLTGSIPTMFCGGGPTSMNFLYRQFACDAVLCPPKTFHPTGAATLHAGCRPCPAHPGEGKRDPPISQLLGRTSCEYDIHVVNGDVNGDGIVSPREVLRLLFVETIGRFWGQLFQNWIDLHLNECDLYGVTCVNGEVAKLDLVNAAMCTNGDHKTGLVPDCRGIPTELALLTRMEVLIFSRRQFLMGTIPSEIGLMTRLKHIDFSDCPYMSGPLPSELGRLTDLKFFNVIGSSFNQSVPSEMYDLTTLEKLHLSNNIFTGTIPASSIGHLENIKELFYSNNYFYGTIPKQVGNLTKLENVEMYGNELNGSIPETFARCTHLKRIDLFSNKLTGILPKVFIQIESLQILHLKMNLLTGSIPSRYGELSFLSWFDVSHNLLHGTIPSSFGHSASLRDFRLGGNMFYDPIPQSLCNNPNINGGLTTSYGCDGVICPLGTYSDSGHASHADRGCKKCPEGETNMYLGSFDCRPFSTEDILSIFFDAMQGDRWPDELQENWKNRHVDICYWSGIICDTKGDIVSIGFPIAWDDWAQEGLAAPLV